MFGENLDMNALMQQAQAMQAQLQQAQEQAAAATYTASVGSDMVSATVNGLGEVKDLSIASEVCDPEDTETLADLILAAISAAKQKADEATTAQLPNMPDLGSLGL